MNKRCVKFSHYSEQRVYDVRELDNLILKLVFTYIHDDDDHDDDDDENDTLKKNKKKDK